MEEKQHPPSNGTHDSHPDWATLVTRSMDDVSRILHSEVDLLQINLVAALRIQIDYALATFAMMVVLIGASVCAVAALVLLLHQSFLGWRGFPWWQALAIGAAAMFVIGIAIRQMAARSTSQSVKAI
ncbi:MAG: phage holin family protein [Candidatus Binataceae bacterium]|nr:phage holin family protein [Candidatus Binataceae bacterium]